MINQDNFKKNIIIDNIKKNMRIGRNKKTIFEIPEIFDLKKLEYVKLIIEDKIKPDMKYDRHLFLYKMFDENSELNNQVNQYFNQYIKYYGDAYKLSKIFEIDNVRKNSLGDKYIDFNDPNFLYDLLKTREKGINQCLNEKSINLTLDEKNFLEELKKIEIYPDS